jgi:hypothetical protein
MTIVEHNENYCKSEITDAEGRKQVLRRCVVVDLTDDCIEVHLVNLDEKLRKLIKGSVLINAEIPLAVGSS